MKQYILLSILAVFCLGLVFYPIDTVHAPYILLRAEADENATTIDLTSEGDFANIPSGAVQIKTADDGTQSGVNAIEVIFCGGDTANETFTYTIWAWRERNGAARKVATGTGTLGTQAVVKYPHDASTATSKFWADTLSCTDNWLKDVTSSDASGDNNIASVQFDLCGYEYIYVEITNAAGSGSEAGEVSAYYSYF